MRLVILIMEKWWYGKAWMFVGGHFGVQSSLVEISMNGPYLRSSSALFYVFQTKALSSFN